MRHGVGEVAVRAQENSLKKSNSEKVEKALGEPIAAGFDDYTKKLRNNLFLISVVGIALTLGNLELAAGSSFLGLRFHGLTNSTVVTTLFIINFYMLIHFLWCGYDSILAWWVRITGTRLAFVTTGKLAAEDADYPSDPNQSSLYYWWKDEANKIWIELDWIGGSNRDRIGSNWTHTF